MQLSRLSLRCYFNSIHEECSYLKSLIKKELWFYSLYMENWILQNGFFLYMDYILRYEKPNYSLVLVQGNTTHRPLVKQLCDIYIPLHRYGIYKLVTEIILKIPNIF